MAYKLSNSQTTKNTQNYRKTAKRAY